MHHIVSEGMFYEKVCSLSLTSVYEDVRLEIEEIQLLLQIKRKELIATNSGIKNPGPGTQDGLQV